MSERDRPQIIPDPMTARKVLDIIDQALMQKGEEAQKLWDVLTGLRGPDDRDIDLKTSTTSFIRIAAFPRTAKLNQRSVVFMPGFGHKCMGIAKSGRRYKRQADQFGHFCCHANNAARALGLIK